MNNNRLLTRIENGVSHFGINIMISFETTHLNKQFVDKAVYKILQKYPFLRMKMVKDSQNRYSYLESDISYFNDSKCYLKWYEIETEEDFDKWEKRFNFFSALNYDISKCIFNIEIYNLLQSNKYQLYFAVNHAGCDTRGAFAMLSDLFFYFDMTISEIEIAPIESKPFLDIHNNLDHSFDIESLKKEPLYDCQFHNYMQKLYQGENDENNLQNYQIPYVSLFKQFDEIQSKKLFANCRLNSATVQGIISVANTIALVNEKLDLSSIEKPIECANVALIDMRYLFGLELDDVFKAPSCLTWNQSLELNTNLWDVVSGASKKIQELKKMNAGLKWWVKSMNSIYNQKNISWASSIGKITLNEKDLKNINITDSRFYLSFPNFKFDSNPNKEINNHINLHAFTFKEKLTLVFGHSYPSLSIKWGQNYSNNVFKIIESFIENSSILPIESVISQMQRIHT